MPDRHRVVADPGKGPVVVTYQVTNRGGSDLVLGRVSTTCGCSVASIEPNVVGPGRSAIITVEGHPPGSGENHVSIHIETNQPDRPELVLHLTMVGSTSVPYVATSSVAVPFGTVRRENPPERFWIETREREGQRPWIDSVRSSLPTLRVSGGLESERSLGDGVVFRRYVYEARFEPIPRTPGDLQGEILFQSTRGTKLRDVHRLPIHGTVHQPVYATPRMLFASIDPTGERPRLSVMISAVDSAFALEAEVLDDESTPLEVSQVSREGPRILFTVAPPPDCTEPIARDLVFLTNHPEAPEIRLPVRFRVVAE